jgi:hypothetical protein
MEQASEETQELAVPERLRPLYNRAMILAFAEIALDGTHRNVNTTVVFGTDRMRQRSYRPVSASSRGEGLTGRFSANIAVVDGGVADTFVQQAQAGRTVFPGSSVEIAYDLSDSYDGFIPRGDFADGGYDKMPGGAPAWRRRFLPPRRSVNGVPFDEAHLADVVAELPQFSQIDYEPLNLEHALDRIGALDVLYPTHVRTEFHGDPAGVRYTVNDPMGWLAQFGEAQLSVKFYRLGLFADARSFVPHAADMLLMDPPQSVRYWLAAGGIVLDGSGGTFLRVVQMQLGIAQPNIPVTIAGATASLPVSPRLSTRVSAGKATPIPDVFEPRYLASLWREQQLRQSRFAERVFNGGSAPSSRIDGLRLLSEMIRAEIALHPDRTIVRVVDPFGIGTEALQAMIPMAAGVPRGEVWLLSNNDSPPPKSLQQHMARELRKLQARLQGTDPQDILDEKFARNAATLAQNLGVTIRWYRPTISLHDRFLEVGPRIWHVGHSFNRLGCDLSAVVEFRDLEERARLRAIFDKQFVETNLRRSFS